MKINNTNQLDYYTMKKFRTTALMVLSAIVIVAFVGCTKDNPNGGNNNNNHEYVDLGLPSGTLWATCNVGASTPEGYGDYFAWGETTPKEVYNWSTYEWCEGEGNGWWFCNDLTKYCSDSSFGYNGFCDGLTELQPTDDAATARWGNGWHTPTEQEMEELWDYTTHINAFQNNVKGMTFTSANGNSIFLPYTGRYEGNGIGGDGDHGKYGSATIRTNQNDWAVVLSIGGKSGVTSNPRSADSAEGRYLGHTIRPVRSSH